MFSILVKSSTSYYNFLFGDTVPEKLKNNSHGSDTPLSKSSRVLIFQRVNKSPWGIISQEIDWPGRGSDTPASQSDQSLLYSRELVFSNFEYLGELSTKIENILTF